MVVHCWEDKGDWIESTYGVASDEYAAYYAADDRGMCLLPDGHEGPHVFTPTSEITLVFKDGKDDA